jgi:hypothetical protein
MGALLLFSAETYQDFRQRQGCGYDFTFLQKRENDFIMSIKKTITQPKSCSIVGGATVYLPIQCDQNWKGE